MIFEPIINFFFLFC